MRKTFAVLGLGRFGFHVAKGLVKNGENVILCDNSESSFNEIRDEADQIYVLDCTDKLALKEAGITELDIVIVSIGQNIEASILTVMALKELGNKKIIAKASSTTHGAILEKLDVEEVIYPEKQAAISLLSGIIKANVEQIELGRNMKACKSLVRGHLMKKNIQDVYNDDYVKIVAIKRDEEWHLDIKKDFILQKNDTILFIGGNVEVEELSKKIEKY